MRKGLTWLFPSLSPIWRQGEGICLQNCLHHSVVCFSNPYIGQQQSLLGQWALRTRWGRTEATQAIGNVREACRDSWAVPVTYCFQMKLSWCVINSGSLRNWPYLCSSAGVLLLIIPAFIFQDMKEQWPKLLSPTCFNPSILQHSFRTFCVKSATLPTLV